MRAAIYARYSSDLQTDASIDDQVRQCKAQIKAEGWRFTAVYSDRAMSGATSLRHGYQALLADARAGAIDVVVAEALDRLSRDQEDVAALFKQLSFCNVRILTLSEGEISELHVGLKGTMNALFLKDLAIKTRRGLEGRVRQGMSGGGNAYGYDVIREFSADGTPVRGKRKVNPQEAAIVRRIFAAFADGSSPRMIAHALNREGVAGPQDKAWGPSTIYGNWRRGTGILNNDLYVGRLVWNRQRFVKDPATGRRQARLNPKGRWIVEQVPQLRIIADDLWQRVKDRQDQTRLEITKEDGVRSERARRPAYLLSGLLKCGVCGGGFSKVSQHHYGCSAARNRATCGNLLTVRRDRVEALVLDGLRHHLMQPDCVKEFIAEYHRELNRLSAGQDAAKTQLAAELARIKRNLHQLIEAIKAGVPGASVKDEIGQLEQRRTEIEANLASAPAPKLRLHPNLAELYRRKVAALANALNAEHMRAEATTALRGLIEEIRLVPADGKLRIELYGELAALIALAAGEAPRIKHPRADVAAGVQRTLVAGIGFEPMTFRL
jgi:site-specific DNA recombinase